MIFIRGCSLGVYCIITTRIHDMFYFWISFYSTYSYRMVTFRTENSLRKSVKPLTPSRQVRKKCFHDRKHLLIRIRLIKLKSVFCTSVFWSKCDGITGWISNPNLACLTCVTKIYYAFSYTRLISVIFNFFRVQKRLNQTRLRPSKFNVTSLKKCQKGKLPFKAANCMLPTHTRRCLNIPICFYSGFLRFPPGHPWLERRYDHFVITAK